MAVTVPCCYTGKENAEQTLQTSQAEAAKLGRELAEVSASKAAAEADLRQKKSELKRRATELETARTDAAAARKEVKQLQAAQSELETSSANRLKVCFHLAVTWAPAALLSNIIAGLARSALQATSQSMHPCCFITFVCLVSCL